MGRRISVVTIRLETKDLQDLQKLAEKAGTNTNSLIVQILKSHLEWDRMALELGMIPLQKQVIKNLLNHVPETELEKIAIENADYSMGDLQMFTGKQDLDSFLRVTRMRVSKSGFHLSEHSEPDGNFVLTSYHGMGHKWSVLFSAYNRRIVSNLGYAVETEAKENLWITRIAGR